MEKWEQELTKQVNRALPDHIDQRIQSTLNQLKRKPVKKPRLRIGIVAAALVFTYIVSMSYLSPTFVNVLNSFHDDGSVFEMLGDEGLKRGSQLDLAAKVDQQLQIDGQVLTITDVMYDGANIYLGWTASSSFDVEKYHKARISYTVNGKTIGYSGGEPIERLDDGTYAGVRIINPTNKLPDSFILGIVSFEGNQILAEIPVERRGESYTFAINKPASWNHIEIDYESITLFPTTTELVFNHRKTEGAYMRIQLYDESGRVLKPLSYGSQGYRDNGKSAYYFEPLDTIPETITIRPYLGSATSSSKVSAQWNGKPKTLSQGSAGALTILDQNHAENQLTLTYEISGEHLYDQAADIWLERDTGERIYPAKRPEPVRMPGYNNRYQITFKDVSVLENLNICTGQVNPYFLEGLEVTVDLQQ
ncbi:hypothetical protein DNH61_04545 [Paenibacillus sambharensis]|uniref:DUF4179 domain-containing protein n=1 Tax=Paenibacillus sambharensis TaxID=1803190 RepID=A0A2W1LZN8_9BACL|nr:DUF4179 domain-containing protein [Paenibacillus sambharensis]PZD97161.1 hypothetical protein DNH61_04545 [Paenibacillus sambharensis]